MTATVLSDDQVRHARRENDRRFAGWSRERVIRLHRQTVAKDPAGAAEYIAGVRAHLDSGLYSRLYPAHVVEASRLWVRQAERG